MLGPASLEESCSDWWDPFQTEDPRIRSDRCQRAYGGPKTWLRLNGMGGGSLGQEREGSAQGRCLMNDLEVFEEKRRLFEEEVPQRVLIRDRVKLLHEALSAGSSTGSGSEGLL